MEGKTAALGIVEALGERSEIDLIVDDLTDETREVALREPFVEVGREEEVLVGVVSSEVRLRSAVHALRKARPAIVPPSEFTSRTIGRCATSS